MVESKMAVFGIKVVFQKFVMVGDDAFTLQIHMRKPYPQQHLTTERRVYNYRKGKKNFKKPIQDTGKQMTYLSYNHVT